MGISLSEFYASMVRNSVNRRQFGCFVHEKRLKMFGKSFGLFQDKMHIGKRISEKTLNRLEKGESAGRVRESTIRAVTTALGYRNEADLIRAYNSWLNQQLRKATPEAQARYVRKARRSRGQRPDDRIAVLRAGYSGFAPYTIVDGPGSQPVGMAVDLINAIALMGDAKRAVEWHPFTWATLKHDLASRRFDFVADPVYQSPSRSYFCHFCQPYAYFGLGAGIVRKKDKRRFKQLRDVNNASVRVVFAEGWTTPEYVSREIPDANVEFRPGHGRATEVFEAVRLGQADIALNDVPTVLLYARDHADEVCSLWIEEPPYQIAGSFITRREDEGLRDFLNASLNFLTSNGTLRRLDEKWGGLGLLPEFAMRPGRGLRKLRERRRAMNAQRQNSRSRAARG